MRPERKSLEDVFLEITENPDSYLEPEKEDEVEVALEDEKNNDNKEGEK